ncbi:MAG TPA: hypothetical protein VIF15_06035 [Polyangiaceae bacterium]|jgi:hypothetical protein
MALAGCSGAVASTPVGDGGSVVAKEAGDDAGPAVVACSSRVGYFACGDRLCDRTTEVCYQGSCERYDATSNGACGPCPTCSCDGYRSCRCTEDEAGGITVSCGGCYGAPPARLERAA